MWEVIPGVEDRTRVVKRRTRVHRGISRRGYPGPTARRTVNSSRLGRDPTILSSSASRRGEGVPRRGNAQTV